MRARSGEVQAWMRARAADQFGSDCLIWPFSSATGDCNWRPHAWNQRLRRVDLAYRTMWEIRTGEPFPPGLEARHTCDNGPAGCVNLDHIVPGTHVENAADLAAAANAPRGEHHGMAKLTAADVLTIRRRLAAGARVTAVAAEYGVAHTAISRIWTGARWASVGGPLKPHGIDALR